MTFSKLFGAFLLSVLACFAIAQDKKELSDLRAELEVHEQEISDTTLELEKYEERLIQLEENLLAAASELEAAEQGVQSKMDAYDADPVPANLRVLDRAKSLLVLAERKLTSLQSRFDFSLAKKNAALEKLVSVENALAANEKRQAELVDEIAIQTQAKIVAEKRAEAQAAKREAERKAKLAAEASLAATTATGNGRVTAPEPESNSELDSERAAVKAVMDEFNTYLASGVRKRGEIRVPVGYSSINGRFSLTHLGGEIYFAEVMLDAGQHLVSIGTRKYRVVVDDKDAGKLYSVYFDNRSNYNKKLMTFRSELGPSPVAS